MCGRYYIDDETAREIEKLVREAEEKMIVRSTADIRPAQQAWVLNRKEKSQVASKHENRMRQEQLLRMEPDGEPQSESNQLLHSESNQLLQIERMQWGFPGFDNKGLLINARAESILEKRTFRESVLHRRCVIPAKGFYEWNSRKEKFRFQRTDTSVLFMAGCFQQYQGANRFVILTTQANASVSMVHERMPLILEKQEVADWILDDQSVEFILHKTPVLLERKTDYEQISLWEL